MNNYPTHTRKKIPLWSLVGLGLLVALFIINLLTSYLVPHYLSAFLLKQVDIQSHSTFSLLSATAIDAVISEDIPLLETITTQALAQTENLIAIEIENELAEKLVQHSQNIPISSTNIRHYDYPIDIEGERFGLIKIQWNIEPIFLEIKAYVTIVQYFVSGILIVLSVLSFLFIHTLVTRPTQYITRFVSLLSLEQQPSLLKISKFNSQELSLLAASANELANLIQQNELSKQKILKTNCQLEEAYEAAVKANNAKTEFLSSMSHELRTPMNAILGFSQLLETDDLNEEQHDNVHEILVAGRHLLELINKVLDLSKIELGEVELNMQHTSLHMLLNDCITLISPLANQRHIIIHNQLDDLNLITDPLLLKQVFINLLSNAIKYNQESGNVNISAEILQTNRIKVTVSDTGQGLSHEQLSKVFLPFERLDAKNSTIEGSGVGLTLCKRYIEALGGEIGVESKLGKGSCFWFILTL